ncbi:4-hydroxybenzoate solanesyltransferase [Cyanobacterium aponinum UTEX 3222]|uniref:4-hydroxybenzoate solanesyltransferase n=1 Tax=Cyanobacterium aponinum AL20115 TaxID=3090662 RepID=A0AAF1C291_9CHRO|nr:4-hydroxybenzoate solanesyltransferase [Cyanobacterium aponinum]WPF89467.1 4-hydroxybenzoate solanesyltransferase [Cyanobacterium aponinum AL20115]WRL38288.1 4-hydroxybenzoate solanesyltransferase [Cyanobacterium aponinum UTEX 3221]WRL41227.1 4-hydroxybenzoate solanesyltransferase [Cyanobacterium aponinum UTEX 3222]
MVSSPELKSSSLLENIVKLLRWDKPAGRLILMIPALWALFLAGEGKPPLPLVGVVILGSLATSAAGCVINDLWDRNLDNQVERTKTRPLASRALSVRVGIVVFFISLACAAVLAFYLNALSFWLCVGAVPFIVCYPLAKRVFPVPQLVLSLAWGFAVLISWSAVTGNLNNNTWLLWGATVTWTMGFDTVYAMSDKEDDLKVGINSSAIFFDDLVGDAVGLFYALTAGLFAYIAMVNGFNLFFGVAWAIAVILWVGQYIQIRGINQDSINYGQIFSQNVWIGFILLLGIILGVR